MTALSLLKSKNPGVFRLAPENTVAECISLLSQQRIGAVLVMSENDMLLGIISERDVMRGLNQWGAESLARPISTLMTPRERLVTAALQDSVETIMEVMTNWRVRHLPILENEKVIGIVSIGDVVKELLERSVQENRHLRDYLFGF